MKNTCRSILIGVALPLINITATLQADDYTYETNNGRITITGYTGSGGAVTIPGLPVTSIGSAAFQACPNVTSVTISDSILNIEDGFFLFSGRGAFSFCTSLTSVTIGNSVTNIGDWAFAYCTNLALITMPNALISIGMGAFTGCTTLTNVGVPDGVTIIGDGAFAACTSLTNVTVGKSVASIGNGAFIQCSRFRFITVDSLNPFYTSVDGILFNKTKTQLVAYPGGKVGSYTIPNTTISIGDFAFHGCSNLTDVNIPNSVTNIGEFAFVFCSSLASLTIPHSVTQIGDSAFSCCPTLRGAYFRGNSPSLGSDVFQGATNTTVYYLPGTIGWSTSFGGRPTAPWVLPYPVVLTTTPNFGIQTNAFGFRVSWATNAAVVVEASTTLANPVWSPVSTNTLVNGWSDFRVAEWKNYPTRFYRVRQW